MSQSTGLLVLYDDEWLHVCWNDAFAKASTALWNFVCRQCDNARAVNAECHTQL